MPKSNCIEAKWIVNSSYEPSGPSRRAGTYPGFCSMKRRGVFLPLPPSPLPPSPDGILVHCRVTSTALNSPVPFYTPGWREVTWELRVLPKNTTQCPGRGSNGSIRSPAHRASHIRAKCMTSILSTVAYTGLNLTVNCVSYQLPPASTTRNQQGPVRRSS